MNNANNNTKKQSKKEKYALLCKISEQARELQEFDPEFQEFDKLNDVIKHAFYIDEENTEFKTFKQWKNEGFSVKKGSTAFLVWGKPRKIEKLSDEEKKLIEQGLQPTKAPRKFFPLAYLFSNAQVEIKEAKTEHDNAA